MEVSLLCQQKADTAKSPPLALQARYLKFCQDYNPNACCIPGHDLENQIQFENLISGLGPGCKNPMMYPEVRFFYCLGCDPDQPKFTVGNEIRVCKSFLDRLWRDPAYEDCGVMYSNPCPSNWADEDFDPYQCGDTLLLPKQTYNNNVTQFINVFKPPGLEDFDFVSIDGAACRRLGAHRLPANLLPATCRCYRLAVSKVAVVTGSADYTRRGDIPKMQPWRHRPTTAHRHTNTHTHTPCMQC